MIDQHKINSAVYASRNTIERREASLRKAIEKCNWHDAAWCDAYILGASQILDIFELALTVEPKALPATPEAEDEE